MNDIPDQTLLIPLDHQKLLKVTGPDAEKFLQGQTTCDIRRLAQRDILLGAHCDHKGRMHSSFVAAGLDSAGIGLRVHESIAESARAALQKYIVFAKAELVIATDMRMFALIGADTENVISHLAAAWPQEDEHFAMDQGLIVLRHNAGYAELWVPADQCEALWRQLASDCAPATPDQWDLAQIAMGLGQVRAETVGEFIPQMLNFQHVDGISFNKGCYTGQEVVARMHYLGKLKKHMYRAEVAAAQVPPPGTPVYTSNNDVPVGQLVMAAATEAATVSLLFVCPEQSADMPLVVSSPDGPQLRLQPLPYSLNY